MPGAWIETADALVALLNGTVFSLPFVASRGWVVTQDLTQLSDLKVTVIPIEITVTRIDLNRRTAWDMDIAVYVQQRIDVQSTDVLIMLVDEITQAINMDALPSSPARLMRNRIDPAFDHGLLDTHKLFTAAVIPTYRLTRT